MSKYSNIAFFKFSATGNDFVLFDNREKTFSGHERNFFRQICRRRISVGADGVLLIEKDARYDFRMRYFNADGTEAACGNGARTAAYFASHYGLSSNIVSFIVESDSYLAEVNHNLVKLRMPKTRDYREVEGVLEENFLEVGGFIDTGVPHFVLFSRNLDNCEVYTLGKKYRYHPHFHPKGANVDFVEILSPNQIKIRTYERGVERETLSCGTGCVAAACLANLKRQTHFPTEVITQGGELHVHKEVDSGFLFLEGEVSLVYEGKLISS